MGKGGKKRKEENLSKKGDTVSIKGRKEREKCEC